MMPGTIGTVIRAARDLRGEMDEIGCGICRFRMNFGIARTANGKIEFIAQQSDEIGCKVQFARRRRSIFGSIATQGKYVFYPGLSQVTEDRNQLLARAAGAGDMRHDRQSDFGLNAFGKVNRARARRAAGSVGEGNKGRIERTQSFDRREERPRTLIGLGRKELKREAGSAQA